jgi:[acyl-carrier-protein] S-malonyltransferase
MKIAFLFGGQGSQVVGMGHDVYEHYASSKAIFDQANCDFDIKDVCFNGPQERLNQTQYTQPSLLLTSLAIAEALTSEGILADVCAGLSLGEYSALCYAKALDVNQAIDVVVKRGRLMQEALPTDTSGMAAVLSSDLHTLQKIIKECQSECHEVLEIANYNSPSQTVISGQRAILGMAVKRLKEASIRVLPLNVAGAFHTSLVKKAGKQLSSILQTIDFKEPQLPVLFNVSGAIEPDIAHALTQQISTSVQWVKTIQSMHAMGVDVFVEISPKSTLDKLVKQILPEAKVYTVSDVKGIEMLKGVLNG